MLKTALIGTAVAGLLGAFVFGRDTVSYMRTGASSVRNAVKSEVPVEFEIERAREMVEHLVPDIRQCIETIAAQQVDAEHLQEQIASRQIELGTQKEAILALRSDLEDGRTSLVYSGRSYSQDEVKRDLAARFARYKTAEQTLETDQKILRAREKALDANREKLDGMLSSKKDLEVKLEQLEARLKAVQAAETVSSLEIDDSRLTRAKKLIRELNRQLDIKEKMLDAEGQFTGLIPVEKSQDDVPADLTRQIDTYFGDEPSHKAPEQDSTL